MSAFEPSPDAPTPETAVSPAVRPLRTRDMVAAALVVALMAATAWFAIPLGAVPVTLQTFCVVLAALLLPAPWALGAMAAYVALGAAGVPVFAHGQAGLGVIVGPTGGYLIGFVAGAWLGALAREWVRPLGPRQVVADIACAVVVVGVIYAVGWAQLAIVMGLGPLPSFVAGVLPFIGPDALKAAVAVVIAVAVRRAGVRL